MGPYRKTICLLAVFMLSGACFAQADRSLTSPVLSNPVSTMPGTQPVSSYQNSLVRSPNPVGFNGNLIVTGNVGGGKHFRGTVPYNAVSDFGGTLGAGTLDDFLRRSTLSMGGSTGDLTPYYSYTRTVTKVQPGTNMIVTVPSSRVRTDYYQEIGTSGITLLRDKTLQTETSNLTPTGKIVFLPIGEEEPTYPELLRKQLKTEQKQTQKSDYQSDLDSFDQRIEKLRKEALELERQLATDKTKQELLLKEDLQKETTEETEDQKTRSEQPKEEEEKIDIYDQMIKKYQENKEIYDQLYPEEAEKEAQQDTSLPKVEPGDRKLEYQQAPRISAIGPDESQKSAEEKKLSEIDVEAQARVAIEDFKSFASESNDEFNNYMRSAQEHMNNGRFYKAADDYSFASLYKPGDPLSYAGKSQALFAAGEYLSSAINLNRAIEIFNGYVDVKIDIVSMIGDKDTVEKRVADLDTWYEVTKSPELKFLQAYIYLQMDRLDKALDAVEDAYFDMSDVPAVGILRQAIKNKVKK